MGFVCATRQKRLRHAPPKPGRMRQLTNGQCSFDHLYTVEKCHSKSPLLTVGLTIFLQFVQFAWIRRAYPPMPLQRGIESWSSFQHRSSKNKEKHTVQDYFWSGVRPSSQSRRLKWLWCTVRGGKEYHYGWRPLAILEICLKTEKASKWGWLSAFL